MYIVEVIEHDMLLTNDSNVVQTYDGVHLVESSTNVERRKVVGVFHDKDKAEKCRRLQPEFKEDNEYQDWEPKVVIREIDSDI